MTSTLASASIASSSAPSRFLTWRSRPTNGVALRVLTGRRDTTRQAETGSALPSACSGSTASVATAPRTTRQVDSPINTSPDSAADCKREAVFIASPMIGVSPPGTRTSPVVAPIRAASRDPRGLVRRRETLLHLDHGAHGPKPVVLVRYRQAEDAHHRVADELLHPTAVALDSRAHLGEVALQDRSQHLGVVRLPDVVEPTRSQNTAVTVLRDSPRRPTVRATCRTRCRTSPRRGSRSRSSNRRTRLMLSRARGTPCRCSDAGGRIAPTRVIDHPARIGASHDGRAGAVCVFSIARHASSVRRLDTGCRNS